MGLLGELIVSYVALRFVDLYIKCDINKKNATFIPARNDIATVLEILI